MKERRRNAGEWADLLRRYSDSGQSMEAFAATEGLSARYFARKLKRLSHASKRSGFVRVTVPAMPAGLMIQVGEVRIHCTGPVSPRWIGEVAAALRA